MVESRMLNWPNASAFLRRPACAGCGRWRRPAISRAIVGCSIRESSASMSRYLRPSICRVRPTPTCARSRSSCAPSRWCGDVRLFAAAHLAGEAAAGLRLLEEFGRAEPLVRECWMLSGEVDFVLKCVAPDMATFQDFVTHLTAAPHVRNVRTSLVLHNSKYEAAVPLEVKARG